MKKTLLIVFALLFGMATMAQNRALFINESFDGSSMPSGWSIAGMGTSNWSISGTTNAGGSANELMLYWSPQFNGTSRVVMPAVDLTGVSNVTVSFKHALDNYSGAHTIGIATSSDNGANWNVGWSQNYSTSNSWSVLQTITTPDMGQANVQFCLFYTGNAYNINNWYFDDIQIFSLENLDLGINATSLPTYVASGANTMDITVFNFSTTAVTSVEASYDLDNGTPVTQTFNVNIPSLGSSTLTFDTPLSLIPGNFEVHFNILKVNGVDDDIASNNVLTKAITVALASADKIPMIEHFSSSTCGPCVSVNTTMLNFCNNNQGRFTYTKYQMNWPGNGDPYYTAEGGTRRTYYGVSAVPQCFLDGEDQGYAAVTVNAFNQHADELAFMDVRGSFTVSGNTISVKADIMPYIDINARVYVSVNEKETHGNVGSNGETSFHHIFMKMLPNADGTTLDFVTGELQHLEFTQDMTGTHVEEMSDLEVSIWVQDYNSHQVLNSHFAYEYTDVHPYPVENLSFVADGDNLLASWNAPASGNPTGYNVYINGELMAEGITNTEYTYTPTDPNQFYEVEVVALYGTDKTSVKAVAAVEGGASSCDPVSDLFAQAYEYNGQNGAYVGWTNPEGAVSYDLYVGDYFLGNAADQPIFIGFDGEPAGVYTIGVIAIYDDCQSEMATVDFEWLPTSVDETLVATSLYPNPTSGQFTLEGADIVKVEVYNLMGQKVYEAENGEGKTENHIDAANWSKGMYLVSVIHQQGTVETLKLVVR